MHGIAELDELPIDVGGEHGLFELGNIILRDKGVGGSVEDEDFRFGLGCVGLKGGGDEVAVEGDDGVEVGAGATELEHGAASEAESDGGGLLFVEGSVLLEKGVESELGARAHHGTVGSHGACSLASFAHVGGTDVGAIHVGDEDDAIGAGDFGGFFDGGLGDAHPVGDHEDGGRGVGEGVVIYEDAFEFCIGVGVGDLLLDDFGRCGEGKSEEG